MNRYVIVTTSCLIFLLAFFLFKIVLLAIGITLIFLFLITLLEIVWLSREIGLASLIFTVVTVLSVYVMTYLPIEFLITDILLIVPKIPSFCNITFLLFLVMVFSLVNWGTFLKRKLFASFLVSLIVLCSFGYGVFRHQKLAREYLPKIYQVNPKAGIQSEVVEIIGVNLFPVWKKGKVVLGQDEMVIISWEEKLIRAEIPVPSQFGQVQLRVIRSDGVISNELDFEREDPGKLLN